MPNPDQTAMAARVEHLEESYGRMRAEIFGNGGIGMKEQLIKLTQVLKIASFIGSAIGLIMVGDFFTRITGTTPTEVKKSIERVGMTQEELNKRILSVLEVIHEKVEHDE